MRRQGGWIALCLVCVLSFSLKPHAQFIRGLVSGTVTDSAGAVLPGVQVVLTNKSTNFSWQTETSGSGFYRFPSVDPGAYRVEFKREGFETRRAEDLVLRTAQEIVLDQELRVGGLVADISVIETPGIELAKTTPTVERIISDRTIQELPIQIYNGVRDISRLALLAPGVVRGSSFTEFSANGQRSRNNTFMIDGVDNNDLTVTLNSIRPLPEAVEEVQVQTAAYSAEFGRSSGAQFLAVTKSGTNDLHGEAWEYHRGNWMEPLSLLNKRAGLKSTPRLVLNQFGGDLGGAIVRNRTFFFALVDANRRREAPSAGNATQATIPTPAGYAALQNVPPGAGETAAARQAALSALGFLPEVYKVVQSYEALPDILINQTPVQIAKIRIPIAKPANFFYNVARIDHRLSAKDSLSYRYHLDQNDQQNVMGNVQFGPQFSADQSILRQNHAVSSTHFFTSSFINEARLAYTRGRLDFPERAPGVSTVNISGFFSIGGPSNFPQGRLERLTQFEDAVSYLKGRHSLKAGLDLRRNNLHSRFGQHSKGTWTFSSLADFLNNDALRLEQAVNTTEFDAGQWSNAFFFQDDVRVGKHLTINAGLRYEYSTIPLGFFGATDPAVRAIGVPGPTRTDKNNWAPRLGFAYGAGATTLRGGFGMAYDVLFNALLVQASGNYPLSQTSVTSRPATANLFPTLAPKVPPALAPGSLFANIPEDAQRPTTNFWSLSVQRQFGSKHVAEIGYLGNRSYHELRQRDANPGILTINAAGVGTVARLNPQWGPRVLLEPGAKGEYHAGYLRFDRQMTNGLLVGANYTWSANFSDNDEAFGGNEIVSSSPQVAQDFFNYHNEWSRSSFDRPHRFVVHYIYEIPWFSAPDAAGLVNRLFSGWQISGVTEAQSGQPFTIRTGLDTVGSLSSSNPPGRPNYNPNGILVKDEVTNDLRTFKIPADSTGIVTAPRSSTGALLSNSMPGGGNLGRNTFRGPSFQNWNFSVMKRVKVGETAQIQLRGDIANLWNHNNFQNPDALMNSPTFGQNTAAPITDTRQILLSGKLTF